MKEWAIANPEQTTLLVFVALIALIVIGASWAIAFGARREGDKIDE